MGRRFLPRFDPHGLRKHVKGNRFGSARKLTVTAETTQVFQESLPASIVATPRRIKMNIVRSKSSGAST